ncbi:unnamed protein product [Angiostrongylus costaricensis]|uniref:Presenilin n=1 Tax=Angiostrongylus costaricensis TaxID=334426 RepID=A0A0R3PBY5_ANGCS|nr:unnamed protein product [Angiostrongylus costaricensis]
MYDLLDLEDMTDFEGQNFAFRLHIESAGCISEDIAQALSRNSSGTSTNGITEKVKRLYGPSDMVKVFVPVSITMFIVVICVRNFDIYHGKNLIPTPYVIYNEPAAEPGTKFLHAVANAAAFLVVVVISTFVLLCLFYYKFYCVRIYICKPFSSPHKITLLVFLKASLILISVTVTLTIMQVLPQWTSWVLLVTLALWDLFAVLTPCGPLKLLVETAEERGEDLMPAIIYRNIRLGLGDFIFYSLLVGTASTHGDWATTLACFVSILTGLGFTLVLLVLLQKALPALPISVTLGVIAYFSSRFAMSKFALELNRKQTFI